MTPRTWLALVPTATLLMLLAWFTSPDLHRGDRPLTAEPPASPFDAAADLADVAYESTETTDESMSAGPTRGALFARLFEPLRDEELALVGTCPPEDEPETDAGDAVLDAHASALLRCTMWTGVDTGIGVAEAVDSHTLTPMAADTTTDLNGPLLLGLEPQNPTQSADITALMPWWALSGPGTLLPAGATHTGGGMGGGGDAGLGGGVYSGITRGSRTPHGPGTDVEGGEKPETPPDPAPDATGDPVDGLDADVDDEATEPGTDTHEPVSEPDGPSGGRGYDLDMFPPPGVLTIPVNESGGGSTTLEAVPEPGTFLLAGAGLTALMISRRMRA